ncbi:M12 family metallo-peptidase [Aquimonas voraii]|uniref:Metallo-peptidase family M12 n=1 Tax=Aquimonas voraii TaxID=265719 RepID=A0A1G6RSI8_9GAMM|nr:M12 family metallo-peptidase [Aquimonas voraii]SDD06876.1 Metallo-peptidase family M12 [Aquimonas voraii]
MSTRSLLMATTLALLPCLSVAADVQEAWRLLPAEARPAPTELPARSAYAVATAPAILAAAPATLRLPFPQGQREALTLAIEQHADDRYTWRGSLDDAGDYPAVLSVSGDAVAGFISAPEGIWELVPSTVAGESWLIELDGDRLPPCRGPVDPGPQAFSSAAAGKPGAAQALMDSGDQVDVLLMYSPAARDAAGGVSQISAQAQAAVDSANTVFANSGMRMRFRVVGIELLEGWVEGTSSASTELGLFRSNASQQARRNALAADMVSLLVANLPGACGIGYVMRSPGAGFAGSAVQITDRDCAVGNLSWVHEHGHNMGFEHDPANGTSPTSASYPWSFGHYVEGQGAQSYRTVMAYQCPAGGCTRRPHFSSPRVSFNGFPTGVVDQRDNARSGDLVADIVANFRLEQVWQGFANSFEASP